MKTVIYALADPSTDAVRYIGKTNRNVRTRFRAHVNRASKQRHIRSAAWIDGLLLAGFEPRLIVLETVDDLWEAAERFWIASFRAIGADLLNMTIGGAATPGHVHTIETRTRLSDLAKTQFTDLSRREAAAGYARQQWADPDFREMKIAAIRARSADPEYRENQSLKKKEKWLDPDYRTRVLATKAATKCHVAGALKMWERPEYREAQRLARERRYGVKS